MEVSFKSSYYEDDNEYNGFKYFSIKPDTWRTSENIDIKYDETILSLITKLEPQIYEIKYYNKVILLSMMKNDKEYNINKECYSIEYYAEDINSKNYKENYGVLRYLYIPVKYIDNLIRKEKLKNIIND